MVYLDNAATMRVYDSAARAAMQIYTEDFFNPSSTYPGGLMVKKLIGEARDVIAKHLSCDSKEIYFMSCATEANNWAINSGFKNKKGNIVVSAGEHACVYECAKELKNKGFDVRFAPLTPDGVVDMDKLSNFVDENTCFVSTIHVSNETGAINNLSAISQLVKNINPRIIFHADGVQAFLKVNNNVKKLGVDMYSISGHKVGAPKGIGAMYVSSKISIRPFIFGGGQENGMRSGTENTAGILALKAAVEQFSAEFSAENVKKLQNLLINELKKSGGVEVISENAENNGMITAFSPIGTRAEIIQSMCADEGVLIGRGSACSSRHSGNRVLKEMGLPQKTIDGTLRISLSPTTTAEEILHAAAVIRNNIDKLRGNKIG